jgi:hypothetical protein
MVCQLAVALCAICRADRVVGDAGSAQAPVVFSALRRTWIGAREIGALELFKQERERDLLNGVRINFSFTDSI